ncbi:hypothetical protein BDN72DRAFT_881255 [Pluteus cervinus]|uniref:Uncharacterized protein n=1 Tax=Pluteus cervinus TaxID=181527 RepID=A0ACD3AJ76_9AGAR|nr:hypothetical protein BDN72DRAFT_881255 [Pluteus cervinus]
MGGSAGALLLLVALSSSALAFENTFPLLAWSPQGSTAIDRLPSAITSSSDVLQAVLNDGTICTHDAVVIIEQPGLHASDLRSLPSSCHFSKSLASSSSSKQYPYAQGEHDISAVIQGLVTKCNSKVVKLSSGLELPSDKYSKHVVHLELPELGSTGKDRKRDMQTHESSLSGLLNEISTHIPNALLIYVGQPLASSLGKRQSPDVRAKLPALALTFNTTLADGGILKRYQLLTPALIVSLLAVFLILVPIVLFGIRALSSIQSPVRSEAPKDYSATTRKTQ